jgi:LmbE family N-acetylglucosaminyl deacetylase
VTEVEAAVSTVPGQLVDASVLAVVAHPDDESFGLGAVLSALTDAGSEVRVLCLTRGEASTLCGGRDLADVRRGELTAAARHLGIRGVHLDDFPDGGLRAVPEAVLDAAVDGHRGDATALVTFEPGGVTGHPDHRAASAATRRAAARHGLTLLEWGVAPGVAARLRQETGVPFTALEGPGVVELVVERSRQRAAIVCHASQATGNVVLARRLELQGDRERLRIVNRSAGR